MIWNGYEEDKASNFERSYEYGLFFWILNKQIEQIEEITDHTKKGVA